MKKIETKGIAHVDASIKRIQGMLGGGDKKKWPKRNPSSLKKNSIFLLFPRCCRRGGNEWCSFWTLKIYIYIFFNFYFFLLFFFLRKGFIRIGKKFLLKKKKKKKNREKKRRVKRSNLRYFNELIYKYRSHDESFFFLFFSFFFFYFFVFFF